MYITGKVLVPIRCLGAPTHLLYYFLCLTRNVHWMMLKDMRVALVSIFSVLQLDFYNKLYRMPETYLELSSTFFYDICYSIYFTDQ